MLNHGQLNVYTDNNMLDAIIKFQSLEVPFLALITAGEVTGCGVLQRVLELQDNNIKRN